MRFFPNFFPVPPAFLLGVGVLVGLILLLVPHSPALPPTASQRVLRPSGVTLADFKSLQFGSRRPDTYPQTSYAAAAASMGEGSLLEVSPDGHTRTYQWNGGGRWARLEATFRDGYLVGKMHFLLSTP